MKRKSRANDLARIAGVSKSRGMEAVMKAELISAIISAISKKHMTHEELAKRSGLPRSAVTGILSGSLQKITIDRVLRLLDAAGLVAQIRIRKSAA